MSTTVFLSSVSSEFGDLRKRLAEIATRTQRVHVRHQDAFIERGVLTLQRLEEEIQDSDAVLHVIGCEEGSYPPREQIENLLTRHQDFAEQFPDIVEAARNGEVTFTQWEAWLAIYFSKRLCSFFRHAPAAADAATRDPLQHFNGSASQRRHCERLNQIKCYPKPVANDDKLFDELVLALFQLGILTTKEMLADGAKEDNERQVVAHNPYARFDSFCPPDMFVGRQAEIAEIVQTLRSTIFLGEAKTGKSNLLVRIREQLHIHGLHIFPVFALYIRSESEPFTKASDVFERISNYLASKVQETFDVPPSESEPIDHVGSILATLGHCEAKNRKLRLVLLVDDLDKFAIRIPNKAEFFQGLRQLVVGSPLDQHVAVIATSSPDFLSAEDTVTSSLVSRLLPAIYLSAFSMEDCTLYASKAASVIPADQLTSAFYRRIYEATGGNPHLLWTLMLRITEQVLRRGFRADDALTEFERNPVFLWPLFKHWLTRLTVEELTYVLAVANNVCVTNWPLGQASTDRFRSMGVIPPRDTADGEPRKICTLFYRWIASSSHRLFAVPRPTVVDGGRLVSLLASALRAAVGADHPRDRKAIKRHVRAILAAHDLDFETDDRGDFLLGDIDLIISVTLIRRRDMGASLEQIRRESRELGQRHRRAICVCYDLSGTVTADLLQARNGTNVQFVIVNHHQPEKVR